jgi:hypothetical protein
MTRWRTVVSGSTWDSSTAGAAMDFDGMDLAVAGIEPFSEIVLIRGQEPTALGYKRQNVLLDGTLAGVYIPRMQ